MFVQVRGYRGRRRGITRHESQVAYDNAAGAAGRQILKSRLIPFVHWAGSSRPAEKAQRGEGVARVEQLTASGFQGAIYSSLAAAPTLFIQIISATKNTHTHIRGGTQGGLVVGGTTHSIFACAAGAGQRAARYASGVVGLSLGRLLRLACRHCAASILQPRPLGYSRPSSRSEACRRLRGVAFLSFLPCGGVIGV